MAHGHTPQLPEIFPDSDLKVEDERHRYETFEGDSQSVIEQTEYTLNKAPVEEIIDVTGVVDGTTTTFVKGTDYELADLVREREDTFRFNDAQDGYELSDGADVGTVVIVDESGDTYDKGTDYALFDTNEYEENGTIEWLNLGDSPNDGENFTVTYSVTYQDSIIQWDDTETTPNAGSFFYVTYRSQSILSRYAESGSEQLGSVEEELNEVIQGKFVDTAEGEELDEIGKLFGVLGKRNGRDDTQYRIFLKSVVQSFISRGTVNGIKLAISAATEVPIDDITVIEDFEDNEYRVEVIPNTPVVGSLLEQVAEIADPSGVDQSGTTFVLDPEETLIEDSATFTEGQQILEDVLSADSVANFGFGTEGASFENIVSDDTIAIDPNKFFASDTAFFDDSTRIDPNKNSASDEMSVDDASAANRAEASDTLVTDDAFATERGFADENITSDDTIENVEPVNKNSHRWEEISDPDVTTEWNFFEWTEIVDLVETLADTAFIDDVVTIPPKDATTTDSSLSDDTVTVRFNVTHIFEDIGANDVVTIPPAEGATDTGGSDDTIVASQTLVAWDTNNWDTLEWVQEHN